MKLTATSLDYAATRQDTRVREIRLYKLSALLNPATDFFIQNPIFAGTPLADWRVGDFDKIAFTPKIDSKGQLSFGINVSFSDKQLTATTITLLERLATKKLIIEYVDDCDERVTVGPYRLAEANGDSSDYLNLANYNISFVRVNRNLESSEVVQDAIVDVAVSCEEPPSAGLPGDGDIDYSNPLNIRLVTYVECSI